MKTNQKRRDFLKLSAIAGGSTVIGCQKAVSQNSPDQFLNVLMQRRSVRKFKNKPVPAEHLQKILQAAAMAPNAGNDQPWKFLVLQKQEIRDALKKACIEMSINRFKNNKKRTEEQIEDRLKGVQEYYDNCFTAPLFVVVLTDRKARYPGYHKWDGPLAAENLFLAARALGYGTVFYTDSIPDVVTKEVLNIPDQYTRVCITPIGVPEAWPETPEKKDLEGMVWYDEVGV